MRTVAERVWRLTGAVGSTTQSRLWGVEHIQGGRAGARAHKVAASGNLVAAGVADAEDREDQEAPWPISRRTEWVNRQSRSR